MSMSSSSVATKWMNGQQWITASEKWSKKGRSAVLAPIIMAYLQWHEFGKLHCNLSPVVFVIKIMENQTIVAKVQCEGLGKPVGKSIQFSDRERTERNVNYRDCGYCNPNVYNIWAELWSLLWVLHGFVEGELVWSKQVQVGMQEYKDAMVNHRADTNFRAHAQLLKKCQQNGVRFSESMNVLNDLLTIYCVESHHYERYQEVLNRYQEVLNQSAESSTDVKSGPNLRRASEGNFLGNYATEPELQCISHPLLADLQNTEKNVAMADLSMRYGVIEEFANSQQTNECDANECKIQNSQIRNKPMSAIRIISCKPVPPDVDLVSFLESSADEDMDEANEMDKANGKEEGIVMQIRAEMSQLETRMSQIRTEMNQEPNEMDEANDEESCLSSTFSFVESSVRDSLFCQMGKQEAKEKEDAKGKEEAKEKEEAKGQEEPKAKEEAKGKEEAIYMQINEDNMDNLCLLGDLGSDGSEDDFVSIFGKKREDAFKRRPWCDIDAKIKSDLVVDLHTTLRKWKRESLSTEMYNVDEDTQSSLNEIYFSFYKYEMEKYESVSMKLSTFCARYESVIEAATRVLLNRNDDVDPWTPVLLRTKGNKYPLVDQLRVLGMCALETDDDDDDAKFLEESWRHFVMNWADHVQARWRARLIDDPETGLPVISSDDICSPVYKGCYVMNLKNFAQVDERVQYIMHQYQYTTLYSELCAVYGPDNVELADCGVTLLEIGAPPGIAHMDFNSVPMRATNCDTSAFVCIYIALSDQNEENHGAVDYYVSSHIPVDQVQKLEKSLSSKSKGKWRYFEKIQLLLEPLEGVAWWGSTCYSVHGNQSNVRRYSLYYTLRIKPLGDKINYNEVKPYAVNGPTGVIEDQTLEWYMSGFEWCTSLSEMSQWLRRNPRRKNIGDLIREIDLEQIIQPITSD